MVDFIVAKFLCFLSAVPFLVTAAMWLTYDDIFIAVVSFLLASKIVETLLGLIIDHFFTLEDFEDD